MTRRLLAVAAIVAMVATSCDPGAREAEPFVGNWRSDGWGTFVAIDGGSVEIYETTAVHCLSVARGGARGVSEVFSLEGGRLVLRDAGRVVRFDRIEFLPEPCLADPAAFDAATVLAVAAATVAENLNQPLDVEWDGRLRRLGEAVDRGEPLWESLQALLTPLGGVPLHLSDGAGRLWEGRPAAEITSIPGMEPAGREAAVVGEVADGIAYVGFNRLGAMAEDEDESQRTAARVIDEALSTGAVVVDLRVAAGGSIDHALLVATRFVSVPTPVASLEARTEEGFVDAGDLSAAPLPTGAYEGEVVVLIGPGTIGVAEILAWAIGTVPRATLVGSPTAGYPGPQLVRLLPNGWSLGLPNLRVTAEDGTDLSAGVTPDIISADPLTDAIEFLTSSR